MRLDTSLRNIFDLLPDGKIVASGGGGLNPTMTGTTGLVRSNDEWGILAADGTLHASLGEFPGSEFWATLGSDGSLQGGRPHPFGRGTLGAVWGDLVAIGVQDNYEIKAFAADGSLVRIVRREGDPGSPTQADQDAYWDRRYAVSRTHAIPSFARSDAAIREYRSAVVSPTGTTETYGLSRKARIPRALRS